MNAFEEMVVSRGTMHLRFAVMLCGDGQLAEDLVQTVLSKAYSRWELVGEAEQPDAYLKKMLVNEYLSWRRLRSSREVLVAQSPASADTMVADFTSSHADREAAWALLARLPRKQRAVLVLRYYEDL